MGVEFQMPAVTHMRGTVQVPCEVYGPCVGRHAPTPSAPPAAPTLRPRIVRIPSEGASSGVDNAFMQYVPQPQPAWIESDSPSDSDQDTR
jgi:hypothetical protein